MNRTARKHAFVQRVGILNKSVLEQAETEASVNRMHPSRLIERDAQRQHRPDKLKSAARPLSDPPSHVGTRTGGSGEISGQIRLSVRKSSL
jgi:hypothetical protein